MRINATFIIEGRNWNEVFQTHSFVFKTGIVEVSMLRPRTRQDILSAITAPLVKKPTSCSSALMGTRIFCEPWAFACKTQCRR